MPPSCVSWLGYFLRKPGGGWRGLLGLLFGSEHLFHSWGNGPGVHLVHARGITKNRDGIRPRGRQQPLRNNGPSWSMTGRWIALNPRSLDVHDLAGPRQQPGHLPDHVLLATRI